MSSNPRSFLASPKGLKQLQAAKQAKNLTFAAIAEQAGVSADTVSRLFHPEREKRVSKDSLAAIAKALELSPETLVTEGEPSIPFAVAERRIQEALESGATVLDLSGLELTSVPESISQLANLTELYLDRNQLTSVPKELGNLANLTRLDLSHNQLISVPKELGNLANLTQLDLSQNQLTTVPKELGNLANLTRLHLHQNQLTSVPKELGNLVNLTLFSLSQNKLTTAPKELGKLANLTEIILSKNQLTTVPKELGNLANLTRLSLSFNQLTTMPKELGNLANLTDLFLDQNQLTTVPKELGNMTNLTRLSLSFNQLAKVPRELGQLANLTELYLDKLRLKQIPDFVRELSKLKRLDLTHNDLTELPAFLLDLANLKTLLIHGNEKLGLADEILGPNDEQVNNGATAANPRDILDYYFRVLSERTPLNEAKLILVGFGAVGKTSLVNRLIHENLRSQIGQNRGYSNHPMAAAAQMTRRHYPSCVGLWWPGNHAFHPPVFLTERSLYLLVLNGRQGHEDEDADYWLELIHSFGADPP
jgi:internalin A